MKKSILLFLVLIPIFSICQIIYIPTDYPTIQQGINAASNGDTVLVDSGTYIENIDFVGKEITVASLFLINQDTSYISQTIIDGNQNGSVVTFQSEENNTSILCGFTITNGNNSGVRCNGAMPTLKNLIITNNSDSFMGGGISLLESFPIIEDVIIKNNSSQWGGGIGGSYSSPTLTNVTISENTAELGGGICFRYFVSYLTNVIIENNYAISGGGAAIIDFHGTFLENVTIKNNKASENGGGIFRSSNQVIAFNSYNRCSIFSNKAPEGNDIYSSFAMDVIVDTFTVQYPTDFHVTPFSNFSFNIMNGKFNQVVEDLYVSPEGDNTNSGLTSDDPLQTLHHAFTIIRADSTKHSNIYLLEGNYSSTSNNEFFPIGIPDNIILDGISDSIVILDAEDLFKVLHITDNSFTKLKGFTVTGGNHIAQSIYAQTVSGGGGGIYCNGTNLYLEDITIRDNYAEYGGGIFCSNSNISYDTLNRCNIYLNSAIRGNDLYSDTVQEVVVDTFTVMYPTKYHAEDFHNFTFDILNGKIEQVDADLYISPSGDNSNSGLTADDPLLTLHHAFSFLRADSLKQNTIHLLDGTYSPSSTNEYMPIFLPDYISISGADDSTTVLDGEYKDVFMIMDNNSNTISNLKITGGYGLYCSYSNPIIEHVTISDGNGVYCDNSSPYIESVNIVNNSKRYGAGIECRNNSSPTLKNVNIIGNTAEYMGGGIACYENSNPTLENVKIASNAACWGGGVYCANSAPIFKNVLVTDNNSVGGSNCKCGGLILNFSSDVTIINSTITNNSSNSGGAVYCRSASSLNMINTICWGNSLGEIELDDGEPCTAEISYSTIEGGEEGIINNNNGTVNWLEGNIDEDPLFLNSGNHPYSLSDGSSCIDAGTPDTTGLMLPFDDLIGNVRIWDGDNNGSAIIDMGAYEFGSLPVGIEKPIEFSNSGDDMLILYPNPTHATITIKLPTRPSKNTTLTISNTNGQQLITQPIIKPQTEIDISYLPAGIYIIKVWNNKDVVVQKIIKQ